MNLAIINPRELNKHAVQVSTIGQMVKLPNSQKGLLDCLKLCVELNEPLSWDIMVGCYYSNVRKTLTDYKFVGSGVDRKQEWYRYDIMEAYKNQDYHWTYHVRSLVKSWVKSSIGALVMKGELIVLPVIKIED